MKLTEKFLEQYREMRPDWGYGALGWIVYMRTYSRVKEDGVQEVWWETVKRVVEGVYEAQKTHCDKNGLPWNGNKAQASAQKMYDLIFNFKFLPPGRGLWAMGTDYVRERGSAALNNCAFVSTADIKQNFSYPFTFLMDMSMLGVGVGSDTRGAGSGVLDRPHVLEDTVHVVDDSREGWVNSVSAILEAFGHGTALPGRFDYSRLRAQGAALKGFGGSSSGPGPLKDLHERMSALLWAHCGTGQPVNSTLIVDLFNLIGRTVAAGGIRRSAEIMLGSPDDQEFIQLKDPELHGAELKSHRWVSNNSLFAERGMDYAPFVDQIMKNGEPGFFWLNNARTRRRMKDTRGEWDMNVMGQNPCGEISLESGELCNLVEVYPARHESWEDLKVTLKYAYLYAKTVSLIPTHNLQTNALIGKNRRLGVSVSGVAQALQKHGVRPFLNLMDQGYDYLRHMDNIYSKWLCVPQSIKLTTVKPSGTISLLAGATPGVHLPHSEYYTRNVRFDAGSPLIPVLTRAGYKAEPSVSDDNTTVISFPIHEPFFTKSKADATAWEQFELAAQMQAWWADNSVSVTVTLKEHERKELATILSMYETRMKSVSLLPLNDHGYEQAPYQTLTRSEFMYARGRINDAALGAPDAIAHDIEDAGCSNDSCSII